MATMLDNRLSWSEFLEEMNRPHSSGEMHWPNFFVVGPHKTGSTSHYKHLKRHPEIFLPRNYKQMRTFQPEHSKHRGLDTCRAAYADAKGYKAVGEVAPDYFPDPDVPGRIRQVSPNARILIVLRDPVERAFSHYLTMRYINPGGLEREPARTFREALRRYQNPSAKEWQFSRDYIEYGYYDAPVGRYLETFGTEQVQVFFFDDLLKRPNQHFMRMAKHIGVDPAFYEALDLSEDGNPFRTPKSAPVRWARELGIQNLIPHSLKLALRPIFLDMKKPRLDEESRRHLQGLYDPHITRLENLLGKKMPELRKSWI